MMESWQIYLVWALLAILSQVTTTTIWKFSLTTTLVERLLLFGGRRSSPSASSSKATVGTVTGTDSAVVILRDWKYGGDEFRNRESDDSIYNNTAF